MSERSNAFGNTAPGHSIEYDGKVYTVSAGITEGMMVEVENRLYARARKGLVQQRDDMPLDAYLARLDTLRLKYEAGEYAFECKANLEFLKTEKGAVVLAACMVGCDEAEVMQLLIHRGPELTKLLEQAIKASFPDEPAPKAKAPLVRGKRSPVPATPTPAPLG